MNSSVLAKNGGFVTQSLREPRGNRSGVVAALFTMLLLIAGCGGSSSNAPTPAPTFSPAAGAYAGTQNVTVSDTNQSAVLYCTNDGSTPTASSPQCANPIKVAQSQTLSAIAVVPGKGSSAVATAAYTITASASAPTVSGIGPASGSTAGGTSVTVIGTNFTSASSVNFGTTAATSVTVNSATSITAVAPAGTGSVHVTVITSSGRSATSSADLFTYSATVSAPAITGISPNAVPPGGAGFTLTLNGTNFVPGATVLWNNTASAASSVSGAGLLRNIAFSRGNSSAHADAVSNSTALTTTFVSSTELQADVPASLVASAGSIVVAVTNPDGSSTGSTPTGSTFAVGAPAIASIFPASVASGSAGFALAVNGTDFASGSTVLWGNTTLVTTLVSSTQMIAAVPASLLTTAGTATVTVTDSAGTSSGATFTIISSAPVITSLSPSSGKVGDPIAIVGQNFGSAQSSNIVTFNGTAATVTASSPTAIVAVVPSGATTGNVVVTVNGVASAGSPFTVTPAAPAITNLSPASASPGGAAFTLTVNGSNFDSSAKVNWNGTALTTTFVNAGQITAAVPANLIASAGTASITVSASGGTSGASTFTIQSSTPTIAGINPTSAVAGGAAFTLTVNGSNFDSSAKVNWNGTALTTTFVNAGQITAAVSANLIVSAGTDSITVSTTAGTSSVSNFAVQAAAPTITGISPTSVTAGGSAFTLTVSGTSFDSSAKVNWNGAPLTSTYVNGTTVKANVPASLIASAGTSNITVTTNAGTSAVSTFTIQLPAPSITTINPSSVTVGGSAFTLTVNGANFDSSAAVNWNGLALATTRASSTQLTAAVPANLIASTGTASITVATSAGTSSAGSITIQQAGVPTISTLDPASATVGGSAFLLKVNGTGFDSNSVIKWGGTSLNTAYVNGNQLEAIISADLIVASGTVNVKVSGTLGTSAASGFIIQLGTPAISGFIPTSANSNDPSFTTMTVNGVNFDASAVVKWGSTALDTTYVSATQVTATVPANLIASPSTASITVTTSAGVSAASNFIVNLGNPTIRSIDPTFVTAGGATFPLKVTGTNFDSSAKINWNGTAQTTQLVSPTEVDASIDSSLIATAGSATVTVTNSTGTSNSFTLSIASAAPTVTGINPTSGSSAGGTSVTITGTNFTGATAVKFGTTVVANPTVNSDTSITVVSPAGSVGTVDVTVVTPIDTSVFNRPADQFTYLPTISGKVLSGPASSGAAINASVQLYAAGTSGYATGSQAIGSPVTTNSGKSFGISYDCSALTAPGDQLYLVATGTTNTNAVLMTALGSCANIASAYPGGVTINEATTIASAFALAGFANVDTTHGGIDIGAPTSGSSCNANAGWKSTGDSTCNYIGLKNAFATVPNLVDIPSGQALAITPAYCLSAPCVTATTTGSTANTTLYYATSIVPQGRINAMADALAACANPTSTHCSALFTATEIKTSTFLDGGGYPTVCAATNLNTQPADTLQAALNIAHYPGDRALTACGVDIQSGAGIQRLIPSTNPPYTPTDISGDLSLALIFQGGGHGANGTTGVNGTPQTTGLAIDAGGNIWVPTISKTNGSVVVLNNQGAPISAAGNSSTNFGGYTTGVYNPLSIAIDQSGNAWIGNSPKDGGNGQSDNGSLSEISLNTSTSPWTLSNPLNGLTATTVNALLTPAQYGLAIDASNNVWLSSNPGVGGSLCYAANGGPGTYGGSILEFDSTGTLQNGPNGYLNYSNSSCPTALAFDESGYLWTWDSGGGSDPNAQSTVQISVNPSSPGTVAGGPYSNQEYLIAPTYGGDLATYNTNNGCVNNGVMSATANMAMDSLGDSWFVAEGGLGCMYVIPNMTTAGTAISGGAWGWVLHPRSGAVQVYGPIVIDGGDNAWATTLSSYLFAYSSKNANANYYNTNTGATDTALLTPQSAANLVGGYNATDNSPNASGRTGGTEALHFYGTTGLGVDGSGNLWVSGEAYSDYPTDSVYVGSQLTEFIGVAVPAQTPLATALTNSANGRGGIGAKP